MLAEPILRTASVLTKRSSLLLVAGLFALLALTGCGPRAGGATAAPTSSGELIVDLPAIYIDFDQAGNSSIGGMSIRQAAALIGRSIPDISLDPDDIEALQRLNIQHLQLVNTDTGLDILVNGFKMPSLGWSEEILTNLTDLLGSLGGDLGPLNSLLPLLGKINTGIVFRFPVGDDHEPMPLIDPEAEQFAEQARQQVAAIAAGVGDAPIINFTVNYQPDGTWTVQGLSESGVQGALSLFGMDVGDFNLSPSRLQATAGAGISNITVSTSEQGVSIAVNDSLLPTITWGSGELTNVLRLVEKSGIIEQLSDNDARAAGMLDLVEQILPTVQGAEFSMTINFPPP